VATQHYTKTYLLQARCIPVFRDAFRVAEDVEKHLRKLGWELITKNIYVDSKARYGPHWCCKITFSRKRDENDFSNIFYPD
jgi:hypothetical protein